MITNIGSLSEKGALHLFGGNAVSRLLLAASLAWVLSPANAQTPAWQPYGSIMQSTQSAKGSMIEDSIDTSNQLLTSNITLRVYKAPTTGNDYDYYLIAGPYSHAVTPKTQNGNGAGWQWYTVTVTDTNSHASGQLSGVGWCGSKMDLYVTGTSADGTEGTTSGNSLTPATVLYYGPDSVGDLSSQTTNLNVAAGTSGLTVGYDYVITWDDPDVAVSTYSTPATSGQSANNKMQYSARLSSCDSVTLQTKNVDPVSEFGTALQISMIYQVPHGQGLQLNWNNDVWWNFYWFNLSGYENANQVSQGLSGAGAFVADFGSAPTYDGNGNVTLNAAGPQIVDAYGKCLTVQSTSLVEANGTSYWPVYPKSCSNAKNANTAQEWYYTGNSQIVNVASGNCLDIQGGFSQTGTPVAGSALITTACAPALPTPACTASGTCTTGTVGSQQWQLTSSPSVTGSTAIYNTSLFLMSSSGYAVNANPSASPATSTYTIEQPNNGTCFVLPLNNTTTPVPGSCSLTPAQ